MLKGKLAIKKRNNFIGKAKEKYFFLIKEILSISAFPKFLSKNAAKIKITKFISEKFKI